MKITQGCNSKDSKVIMQSRFSTIQDIHIHITYTVVLYNMYLIRAAKPQCKLGLV